MEHEKEQPPTRKTEKDILTEFIELYRSNPCLWKVKSKEYADKFKKDEAYKVLVDHMKQLNPDTRKDDVVKKINSLRSCFRKEYKKVVSSTHSGTGLDEIYKPNLWYYPLLLFLKDSETPRPSVGNDRANYLQENEDDNNSDLDKTESNSHDEINVPSSPLTPACSEGSSSVSTQKRRRLKSKIYREEDKSDQILSLLGQKLQSSRDEDEYDIIGKNVAEKLRKIELSMKIYAERLINEVLFEAQLGTLTRESFVNTSCRQQPPNSQYEVCNLDTMQKMQHNQNVRDYYAQISFDRM